MKLQQVFSETDLSELEQVLARSMGPKTSAMRFWQKHRKAWQRCLVGCAILLFVDCVFLLTRIKWLALITAIFGAFALLYVFAWNKLTSKFLNPEKAVQKYREPFVVSVEENTLHYRRSNFAISSIDHIVEYKCFLFIRANRKWCFIKAEEEEKAILLSKLSGNADIIFTKIEEPVDLRQF